MRVGTFCTRFMALTVLGLYGTVCCSGQIADRSHLPPSTLQQTIQTDVEPIDLGVYQRIRDEGLQHSRVMDYAYELSDRIGPRLTGSPNMRKANEWTRNELTALGCANAHLEDWGDFGTSWEQLDTSVRMISPDVAVFIAQAAPWSPPTKGVIRGDTVLVDIQTEQDFDRYRGKLHGRLVLLGPLRSLPPLDKALFRRFTDQELVALSSNLAGGNNERESADALRSYVHRYRLREKIAKFMVEQGALAVIRPSRDQRDGGGSGGTILDDSGMGLSHEPYKADRNIKIPIVVLAIENYGRVVRLLKAGVSVTLAMNVETKVRGTHEHGYNTIAEIPGSDPKLKDQIVMVGAHLDSWASGTGATDNAAGVAVTLEVARILKALNLPLRRTIRLALWSGEEQGIFGSRGYVRSHLADIEYASGPDAQPLPEDLRPVVAVRPKKEYWLLSAYFNVDYGPGRIRGVYLEGNTAVAPIFSKWIAPLGDLGVSTLSIRGIGSTDHTSFDQAGIPGFQFIQDELDYETRAHHSNMDTFERLVPADLKQIAVVEAIFVYETAMRDNMLPRKMLSNLESR